MRERISTPGLPRTSVIFVGYNGAEWIATAISSALDQERASEDYEILYVDNASTDGSAELVERSFPDVRVIRLHRNVGFYAAFNLAAQEARGEYLIAVPHDVVLHRQWLRELVRAADADERVLLAVPNTLGPSSPDYRPGDRERPVAECAWVSLSRLGYVRIRNGPQSTRARQTLAGGGCSMLLRRDLVRRSGRFFEAWTGHYAGDVEVGIRASILGGLVIQVPTAVEYHLGEERKRHLDPQVLLRYAEGSRDQVLLYYVNMPALEFALFLPLLWLGLSLKTWELRIRPVKRAAFLVAALAASPLVVTSAFLRMPGLRAERRARLRLRRVDHLWLLRRITSGGLPAVEGPAGLMWGPRPGPG